MKFVVFGATGFLGGQIARAALEAGHQVRGLRRATAHIGTLGDLPVEWVSGDLNNPPSLLEAISGCDVLYHAAGYYPSTDRDVGRAIARARSEIRAVLDAARAARIRRMVFTSSLTTIGSPPAGENRLADERDAYTPGSVSNAYFEAKWVMEAETLAASSGDFETLALVPTLVFGPGDLKPSSGQALLELARGRLPVGIDMVINVVDGRDVALAHVRAAQIGQPGERVIIGGHNLTVSAMLTVAAHAAGVRPPRWTLSRQAAVRLVGIGAALRLPIPESMRGIEHFQALNPARGWHTFGFEPRPFEDTARDAIDWFRQHGYFK